jgi:type IV pilus assembly protein PilX
MRAEGVEMAKPNHMQTREPVTMDTRALLVAGRDRRLITPPRTERGVVVFIALIVLVAMTLAGLAVMRSSNTAILTAGNLSFKQGSVLAGDAGLERGIVDFLRNATTGAVTLEQDVPLQGYYATWYDGDPTLGKTFDPITWPDWDKPTLRGSAGKDSAGNTVYYVIHRMCRVKGPVSQDDCVVLGGDLSSSSKGGGQYGEKAIKDISRPYFRLTARIEGPKQTISYVQSMIY